MQKNALLYNSLWLLLICTTLIACSTSSQEIPSNEEEQTAIGFAAKVQNSRAVAELEHVQDNGFSVWGGFGNTNVFDATKVTYTDAAGWGYGETRYWTYNSYNFYAVYPDVTHNAYPANKVMISNTSEQLTIKEFNSSLGYDLMYAKAIAIDGSTPPAEVALTFNHTMTQLSVSLKKHVNNEEDEVKVIGVYVYGMYGKGDYELTASTEAWTNLDEITYYGKEVEPKTLENEYVSCATGIMVIPQPFTGMDINLLIAYSYKANGAENSSVQYLNVPIPTTASWDIRKKITYNGTIEVNDKIVFSTPVVESWGAEQAGGTVIIK